MRVDERAVPSLELEKILDSISVFCRSELGIRSAGRLVPAKEKEELASRQNLLRESLRLQEVKGDLPWDPKIAPIGSLLEEAKESGILTGAELVLVRRVLSLSVKARDALLEEEKTFPTLGGLARKFRDFSQELRALSVLDDEGRLYDHASPKLAKVRQALASLRISIRQRAQSLLGDSALANQLQEKVLTLRNGRYVLLVRQEHLHSFPGIAVERSGSGSSVYMEPYILVPLNNEQALLQQEEREEEKRLLFQITATLLSRLKAIEEAEETLGTLDFLYAVMEKMRRERWSLPEIGQGSFFDLRQARHPLLGERAVPIDLRCGREFRILVITGPNTGGKTVALKTAGVCVFLAWCGLPIPASEGSSIGDISSLFTDIGDEQSIEQNLSTFSAHINQVIRILRQADSRSLILLDELGAGTDPEEGAALGIAVLEALLSIGCLVLATTHHNPIKRFALTSPHIETASVEFDPETLSPTYRLAMGIPGRSNALLIAEKLGMPKEIVERAKNAMSGDQVSIEELIGELQEKRAELEREHEKLLDERLRVSSLRESLEKEKILVEEKRKKSLLDAERRALNIVRGAEEAARALLKRMEKSPEEASAKKEWEKGKPELTSIAQKATRRMERELRKGSVLARKEPLHEGDGVQILGTKVKGVVERVEEDKAHIVAGALRLEVPLSKLGRLEAPPQKPEPSVQLHVSQPKEVPSSLMIRRMTVDEALPLVEQYLDQAYRAGYGEVTIIHGRGEGILRREVHELCRKIPYVESFRLGEHGEGGYGVTIVRFKRG